MVVPKPNERALRGHPAANRSGAPCLYHWDMATWRDGPEYSPVERPADFTNPPVGELFEIEVVPSAAKDTEPLPTSKPAFAPPDGEQPDLAALAPTTAPGRNPNVPFDVASASITADRGWQAPTTAGQRPPQQPFNPPGPPLSGYLPPQRAVQPAAQVNPPPFPSPGTPGWFVPPPPGPPPGAPVPVSLGQIWQAVTPGVVIPLLLGAAFSWLSVLMLLTSFALSARIGYRRTAVQRSYLVALLVVSFLGAGALLEDGVDATMLFDTLSAGAQVSCWILPLVLGAIVSGALRAGEPRERVG